MKDAFIVILLVLLVLALAGRDQGPRSAIEDTTSAHVQGRAG